MGRRPATVIEYRSYELPSHFPMRIIAGEDRRISDVPCGLLHFHKRLDIGLSETKLGDIKETKDGYTLVAELTGTDEEEE